MSVYSYDKLIGQTHLLAAALHRATGTLLPVSSEIACHDSLLQPKLGLLNGSAFGFDA